MLFAISVIVVFALFYGAYWAATTMINEIHHSSPPKPPKLDPPRFTVEIETCVVDIQQPEKKVSKFLVERGYLDPIHHTQEVLRIYVRDTKQHYYTNRDAPPFAQIPLNDPDFDTKAMKAKAEAEDRASTLESLRQ